jgi:hypothetical protein
MGICQKCGKTVSLRELSKNYGRCQDCFGKECSDYEYWKARQLSSPDVINKKATSGYISESDFEKKRLIREMNKDKENVQIILDFSSLNDVMKKTGITMTKFECPNCKGSVKIPEAGNIIICQFCRTPIRPNEIFKKIYLL